MFVDEMISGSIDRVSSHGLRVVLAIGVTGVTGVVGETTGAGVAMEAIMSMLKSS